MNDNSKVNEFNSFFKTVGGNEGNKCHYPTRLDTYGCGCQHNCKYCYAKALLDFRKLWNPMNPSIANINKIRNVIRKKLNAGDVVRLGGMTDCFQPLELKHRVTYETIKELNANNVGFKEVSVCEDVDEHYEYWKKNVNVNKDDCCNLRVACVM